ncbi:hypothetical protein [Nitrosomonas sp.]|uniref:hypothetical protein n=1 Tax=Nitrosomonas sp. TaxID=42353 RepID=UPI00208B38C4|nr:hypothetical protein [Nitrosomonas sp.]GJL75571.1 MAG: hypothetical protein NMNS02_16770 [Nitrosomonas sp.]
MSPPDALIELIERIGTNNGNVIHVSADDLDEWPNEAVSALKKQKLLIKAKPASSAICPGCEQNCVMPVHIIPEHANLPARAFVSCDKRDDTSRVAIPFEKLNRWQCNINMLCQFIVQNLKLHQTQQSATNDKLHMIGMAAGNKRSQMLCLEIDGIVSLVAGNNKIPLIESIGYHDGAYTLNETLICQLIDNSTTADDRYTPNNARREARKLDTAVMHESWRKEYRVLKKRCRGMSDVWYSQQIAKLEIAKGRRADTIRKNMKT